MKPVSVDRDLARNPTFKSPSPLILRVMLPCFVVGYGELRVCGITPDGAQRARPASEQTCVHRSVDGRIEGRVFDRVMRLPRLVRRVDLRLRQDRHEAGRDERNKHGEATNHLRTRCEAAVQTVVGDLEIVLTTIDSRDFDFRLV